MSIFRAGLRQSRDRKVAQRQRNLPIAALFVKREIFTARAVCPGTALRSVPGSFLFFAPPPSPAKSVRISPMSTYLIIPCLDIINRRVTKGVKFKDNIDFGDPVEFALRYCEDGADELVVYDVTASAEHRPIDIEVVRRVAEVVKVPLAVGGGIGSLSDMERVFELGAAKVSVNSLAVKNPALIAESVKVFGSKRIVLGMDPFAVADTTTFPSGYEITTRGFRERSGKDAVDWAKEAADLGVGEIVVNSVDADGMKTGFDLKITGLIADAVSVPVIASGGAGNAEHVRDAYTIAHADAAIVAGILHAGLTTISELKEKLRGYGVPVR